MKQIVAACALCLTALSGQSSALGAEYVRKADFGQAGDVATYGAANFDYLRNQPGPYNAVCTATFAPGVLYFVSDHLGIGAAVQSGYASHTATSAGVVDYNLGVVPKITYKLTLTDELSLLPEISVGVGNAWEQRDTGSDGTSERLNNGSQVTATFYVPLLVKPAGMSKTGLQPTFTWDLLSRFTFNNGTAQPASTYTPMGWPNISCQSTLGIHF